MDEQKTENIDLLTSEEIESVSPEAFASGAGGSSEKSQIYSRYGIFALLFISFLFICILSLLNTGDQELSKNAQSWLALKTDGNQSLAKTMELAASLGWRNVYDKPSGEQIANETKLAMTVNGPDRWDALTEVKEHFKNVEIPMPKICGGAFFCAPADRDAAAKEIEASRIDLATFRELLQQPGLASDMSASLIAPDLLSSSQLASLAKLDLVDIGLNADRNPSQVLTQLGDRARFWKASSEQKMSLATKAIVLENLKGLSLFTQAWVEQAAVNRQPFTAKAALLMKMSELKVDDSTDELRKILEPSFAHELQLAADSCDMIRNRPKRVVELLSLPTRILNSIGAKIASRFLGRTVVTGFQQNRTLNLVQKALGETLAAKCLENDASCSKTAVELNSRGLYERLQNPTGRELAAALIAPTPERVNEAREALRSYNQTLGQIAKSLGGASTASN